jgi:hypothetical protein
MHLPYPDHELNETLFKRVLSRFLNLKVVEAYNDDLLGKRVVQFGEVARRVKPETLQKRLAKAREIEERIAAKARAAKRARTELERALGGSE